MFSGELKKKASDLQDICKEKGIKLVTAESCTGGLIAALLTEKPGSSHVYDHGFVTYSDAAKTQLLNVSPSLLAAHGAVSEEVAVAMARNARAAASVDFAVSVTGIAGPDGAKPGKPVGTVCIAVAGRDHVTVQTFHFEGTRSEVRLQSVEAALEMLKQTIQ